MDRVPHVKNLMCESYNVFGEFYFRGSTPTAKISNPTVFECTSLRVNLTKLRYLHARSIPLHASFRSCLISYAFHVSFLRRTSFHFIPHSVFDMHSGYVRSAIQFPFWYLFSQHVLVKKRFDYQYNVIICNKLHLDFYF